MQDDMAASQMLRHAQRFHEQTLGSGRLRLVPGRRVAAGDRRVEAPPDAVGLPGPLEFRQPRFRPDQDLFMAALAHDFDLLPAGLGQSQHRLLKRSLDISIGGNGTVFACDHLDLSFKWDGPAGSVPSFFTYLMPE
ncbi:hypothetical protein D1872_235420 [compost metagenome]